MGIFDKSSTEDPGPKGSDDHVHEKTAHDVDAEVGEIKEENKYAYDDSRKLGITGAVFLILNKMIGTGIFSTPSSIFAATGSVGISLMLWVIGETLLRYPPTAALLTRRFQAASSLSAASASGSSSAWPSRARAAKRTTWSASTGTPSTWRRACSRRR